MCAAPAACSTCASGIPSTQTNSRTTDHVPLTTASSASGLPLASATRYVHASLASPRAMRRLRASYLNRASGSVTSASVVHDVESGPTPPGAVAPNRTSRPSRSWRRHTAAVTAAPASSYSPIAETFPRAS